MLAQRVVEDVDHEVAEVEQGPLARALSRGADPHADYRGLVQTLAESGGSGDRVLASLRALWA